MNPSVELARFHVLATLAAGDASSTHKVLDPIDGSLRVARSFRAESLRQLPALRQLVHDARAARSIEGAGLAPWREVVEEEERFLLVRDWIDASSLASHASFALDAEPRLRGARPSEAELEALLAQALAALLPIHDRGLAALRISPRNLFLTASGELRLSDWGVRIPATSGEALAGCRHYQAPELRKGAAGDASSDLWSLGAVLFEIALGRLPNAGEMAGVLGDALGNRLAPLIARLLHADPTSRFASAREALAALGQPPVSPPRSAADSYRSARTIGRESELGELRAAIARLSAGQGELLFVRGEAGVGKSRLLDEVARVAALADIAVLRGGPPDYSGYPFGRLVPCFDAIAREKQGWSSEQLEEALQGDGRVLLEVSSAFYEIEELRKLGEPPVLGAEASRRRLLRVAARSLAAFARHKPVLLLLDDLDSADALSLEFVRYLARTVVRPDNGRRAAPVLVVACYAEEAEARGPLRAAVVALRAKGLAREIVLKPLAPHEVRDLLVERLGPEGLPGGFVARVMSEAGGVPLKIEETLAWLARHRILEMPVGAWTQGWTLARQSEETAASTSDSSDSLALLLGGRLRPSGDGAAFSIVGLRLRGVCGDTRRLLETVATAGDGAPYAVVRQASGLAQVAFDEALAEAMQLQVLVEASPELLSFRHDRLRDAVIAEMDAGTRRAVHARLGLAIEQNVGRLDERTPLRLAHHFHQAGDVERCLLYLPLAARILKDRHVPAEALTLFGRFFRHLDSLEATDRESQLPKRLQALQAMAETLIALDRGAEASGLYREMAAVAESSGRERDLVSAWSGLAALHLELGDLDTAESFGARAAELARRRDLALMVAENLRVLGMLSRARGRHGQALWELSGALRIYREQSDTLGEARTFIVLGDVHQDRYRHRPALLAFRKAYQHFRSVDDKVGVSNALNRLGSVHLALGDAARAIGYHREAARLEREADDREGVARTLDLLGDAYREKGELERAAEAFKEALAIKRELANVRGSADSLISLAHVALQAGRIEEASGILEQTLTLARRTSNSRAEAGALVRLAQARFQRGDTAGAVEQAEDGLARAHAAGDRALECRALLVLASAAATPEAAMRAAERAGEAAAAMGLNELLFRACVRKGDLLRAAGRPEDAQVEYLRALDAASALVQAARSARDGFLRRDDVRASLRNAGSFLAERTPGDLLESYPVLRFARDIELAAPAAT